MNAGSESVERQDRHGPAQVVSGYLAALGIFAGVIAIAWHPLRLSPLAMLLALVAAAMAPQSRLARAAAMITAVCFFLGMTVSVVTSRPLW